MGALGGRTALWALKRCNQPSFLAPLAPPAAEGGASKKDQPKGERPELLGHRMDYVATRIQSEFPDCEAFREVAPGPWQRVRIEFEFESRNFLLHKHNPKKCDLIVCWKHNWAECPANIEVIELSSIMKRLM
jgi:hypothetical protein